MANCPSNAIAASGSRISIGSESEARSLKYLKYTVLCCELHASSGAMSQFFEYKCDLANAGGSNLAVTASAWSGGDAPLLAVATENGAVVFFAEEARTGVVSVFASV